MREGRPNGVGMRLSLSMAVAVLSLMACGGKPQVCITGDTKACACVDGKSGAQACLADGTYGACQCGSSACNAGNCSGCCDATGTCQTGNSTMACGGAGALCLACGNGQSCVAAACVEPSSAGGGSGAGGGSASGGGSGGGTAGGGSAGGGSVTQCNAGNCAGCCLSTGECVDPVNRPSNVCGVAGVACGVCTSTQACVSNACTVVKRVFATKSEYPGQLGGLAGGDAKCATAAAAANLGGTWKAWLSDATTPALARIADVGPWYRVESPLRTRVFNNKANLQTSPLAGITTDENGTALPRPFGDAPQVWTGTAVGGSSSTFHCQSWTFLGSAYGTVGLAGAIDNQWTISASPSCANSAHLYCFEQ